MPWLLCEITQLGRKKGKGTEKQKAPADTGRGLLRAVVTAGRWGGRWDSNPRQPESQSGTLPTELRPPLKLHCIRLPSWKPPGLARPAGLEPATLGLEGRCSIRMSYGRRKAESAYRIEKQFVYRVIGRGRGIRTPDILLPKQARYRTALYPEIRNQRSTA